MTKKSVDAICLMILLFITFGLANQSIQNVSSQTVTTVLVSTPTDSPPIGQAFTVTISLSNVQNLYGLEVILNWNATVLQATNIDIRLGVESFPDGVLHTSSNSPSLFIGENNLTQSTGEYRLVATSVSPALPFTGSGNIVKITFNPVTLGDSRLDLKSQLSDYPPTDRDPRTSLPIEHIDHNALVTVTEATNMQSNTPATSTAAPSNLPTTSTNTPSSTPTTSAAASSSAPTESGIPLTPTPSATSTLPAASQTLDKSQWLFGLEFVLPFIVLVILGITILTFLVHVRRKK